MNEYSGPVSASLQRPLAAREAVVSNNGGSGLASGGGRGDRERRCRRGESPLPLRDSWSRAT